MLSAADAVIVAVVLLELSTGEQILQAVSHKPALLQPGQNNVEHSPIKSAHTLRMSGRKTQPKLWLLLPDVLVVAVPLSVAVTELVVVKLVPVVLLKVELSAANALDAEVLPTSVVLVVVVSSVLAVRVLLGDAEQNPQVVSQYPELLHEGQNT